MTRNYGNGDPDNGRLAVSGPFYDYNIIECLVPLVQVQRSFLREEIELPWK